jgi:hypothetical protein
MTKSEKYILIPPGGPSGPFWGVMKQSGPLVAMQIVEQETAELLITILSITDGDFDTVQAVAKEFRKIWDSNPDLGAEDYLVRQFGGALVNHVGKS